MSEKDDFEIIELNEEDSLDLQKIIYLTELTKEVKKFNWSNRIMLWGGMLVYPALALLLNFHWEYIVGFSLAIAVILYKIALVRRHSFQLALIDFIERHGLMNGK